MYRTKTNGELRLANVGEVVTLAAHPQDGRYDLCGPARPLWHHPNRV